MTLAPVVGDGHRPFVGDFSGDRRDDIFWYGPGTLVDSVWFGRAGGAFVREALPVGGT